MPKENDDIAYQAIVLKMVADELQWIEDERAAQRPWYHYLNPLNWLRWLFGKP